MSVTPSASRPLARQFTREYLLASLVPLLVLVVSTTIGASLANRNLARLVEASTLELNRDAQRQLQLGGERVIENQAQAVARQVEILLRSRPSAGMAALQADPEFRRIAIQHVGLTGYTCLYEAGSGIMRLHPNATLMDREMEFLSETLPSWWSVFGPTLKGVAGAGYYDWIEADGSVRQKFMSIAPVAVPVEGRLLMVAATTYIDEFQQPLLAVERRAGEVAERYRAFVTRQGWMIGGVHLCVLLMAFGGVMLVGRRAQRRFIAPIQALARAAQHLGQGRWETAIGAEMARRPDEIGALVIEFGRMQAQLKRLFTDLEARLAELGRTQRALAESEAHHRRLYETAERAREVYQSLLDSSADAIVCYDLRRRVTFLSPAFTRLFGWSAEELTGSTIPFIPEGEEAGDTARIAEPAGRGIAVQAVRTSRLTRDGRRLTVSISASRFNDHRGQPAGILEVIRDISDQERLEEQFFRAQKMEAVGTLAGGIAHDFNNIMMGIQGNASLMLLDLAPGHPHFDRLKNIERYVLNGSELTRQLLGFARGGKYEVRPTDLNRLIAHNTGMFGRTHKEITIQCRLEPDLWAVEVDRGQMEQVFLNLYVNAWQAMPEGGRLTIATHNVTREAPPFDGSGAPPGRYVKIAVGDTGSGMDEAVRQRIFEPFFTTKPKGRGTGLGLSSVYGIVRHHGGLIEVHSEKGSGTTFDIYLPASDRMVEEDSEPAPAPQIVRGVETVLLVDDEEMVLDVGRAMLERLGYRLITARSGREAIAAFERCAGRIDLAILDMVLPDMSGGEIFNQLRARNGALKVLLASGYSIDEQAREVLTRGGNGFIQKPFSLEQLSRKLREVLGMQPGALSEGPDAAAPLGPAADPAA